MIAMAVVIIEAFMVVFVFNQKVLWLRQHFLVTIVRLCWLKALRASALGWCLHKPKVMADKSELVLSFAMDNLWSRFARDGLRVSYGIVYC